MLPVCRIFRVFIVFLLLVTRVTTEHQHWSKKPMNCKKCFFLPRPKPSAGARSTFWFGIKKLLPLQGLFPGECQISRSSGRLSLLPSLHPCHPSTLPPSSSPPLTSHCWGGCGDTLQGREEPQGSGWGQSSENMAATAVCFCNQFW